jgi:putative DNA primase/helicase
MVMNLQVLAQALSGCLNGKWINVRGPGHSTEDRSLGFTFDLDAPDGIRIHSFAGDDLAVCRAYIKARLHEVRKGGALDLECARPELRAAQAARIFRAIRLWNESLPVQASIAEAYLSSRRCRPPSHLALRFHPNCPFGEQRVPAMIALMRDVLTDEPTGIHRTALVKDGSGKCPVRDGSSKRMMGAARGAAVKLGGARACLGIAEGIETALSAGKIFDMPVWAAMSAQGVAAFPIIPGLEHFTIYADNDDAGLVAASKCARRYARAGIEAKVHQPPHDSKDWNDYAVRRSDLCL